MAKKKALKTVDVDKELEAIQAEVVNEDYSSYIKRMMDEATE